MSFTGLLTKVMDVFSVANTPDAYGGWSTSPTLVASNVPCRVREFSLAEKELLARAGLDTTHRIYCDPLDVQLTVSYLMMVDALTYRVTAWTDPDMEQHHYQVDVRRVS